MIDSKKLCSICGEGHLQQQVGKNPVEYKGCTTELDLFFSICDACGSEQSDASQLRANKRAMVAFKKQVDGLLAGAEVRALREQLGLTQVGAAQVFGGGPVAFSKYESDDVAQSEAMDKLLRLSAEFPPAFEMLARRAGLDQTLIGGHWRDAKDWVAEFSQRAGVRRAQFHVVSTSSLSEEEQGRYAA